MLAQRLGLHLADYVVNETGFAADLGAEKFFDIVMPMCGHVPSVAVMIVTLKALRAQGGAPDGPVERGFPNLARHVANVRRWGAEPVVALNRFAADAEADLQTVLDYCGSIGVDAALSEGYLEGGPGMAALAEHVVAAANRADLAKVKPLYGSELSFEQKITEVATKIYGASGVAYLPGTKARLQKYTALGYGHLPVCIAKGRRAPRRQGDGHPERLDPDHLRRLALGRRRVHGGDRRQHDADARPRQGGPGSPARHDEDAGEVVGMDY